MKKRLLITSIVMMLVCAVALSTATYAWFTSNASVNATSMTLRADVSSAPALGIGWTGYAANTSIDSPIDETLQPMAPNANNVAFTNGSTIGDGLKFYTSTVKQESGYFVFNVTPGSTSVDPVTYSIDDNNNTPQNNTDDTVAQSFYIRNLSNANTIKSIKVEAVIPGYIKTADIAIDDNKTYYTKAENAETYTEVASPVVGDIGTYYEAITGDDMIRVALFVKRYSQASGTADGSTTYYKYNSTTNVIEAVNNLASGTSLTGYFEVDNNDSHKLLGVLGKQITTFTEVNRSTQPFDLNTVYFTEGYSEINITDAADFAIAEANGAGLFIRTGSENAYVYTEVNTTNNNANYDNSAVYCVRAYEQCMNLNAFEDEVTYYTAQNTVANGLIQKDNKVRDLYYYSDVTTSITFAKDLKPNEQIDIIAYAWLDGTILDDTRQQEIGFVSLKFSANS